MIVAFFIHLPSLSSPLLLRISPKTFAFIPILHMCLSSLNRSIYAVSRHILPCVAPLCKALHYSKTGVPWHTNNTRIIYFLLLTYLGLSRFFLIFRAFAHFFSLSTIFPFLGFFRLISVCLFHQMV